MFPWRQISVFLMYYCIGCHMNESVGLFRMVIEIFINKEKTLQALQIFWYVTLAPLKGQQLSRPLSIEGCELTYRLIMELPAQEVRYNMLWIFFLQVRVNVPSWCDRILWKSYPETHITCTAYGKIYVNMTHMRFTPDKICFLSQLYIYLLQLCFCKMTLCKSSQNHNGSGVENESTAEVKGTSHTPSCSLVYKENELFPLFFWHISFFFSHFSAKCKKL